MTDRELLELAAKAAGVEGRWHEQNSAYASPTGWLMPNGHTWNPLSDDGDALRLAVKLRLEVVPLEGGGVDVIHWRNGMESVHVCESGIDELAATRRAIVRAAAEIGRSMK